MLLRKCIHPLCKNMLVKRVTENHSGLVCQRIGIIANVDTKVSNWSFEMTSINKNTNVFAPRIIQVITGKCRERMVSLKGIIFYLNYVVDRYKLSIKQLD